MDKKVDDLAAHRVQQVDKESWDRLVINVTSKLAVLRLALGGIENADHGDYDYLEDVNFCQPLIDKADVNERPDVSCLKDLASEILPLTDEYVCSDPDQDSTVGLLVDKMGVIETALDGFRTDDQAIFLGEFVQELMNTLTDSYYGLLRDESKERIKSLIRERNDLATYDKVLKRKRISQASA